MYGRGSIMKALKVLLEIRGSGFAICKTVSDGTETGLHKHPGYGQSIAAISSLSAENFKGMSMPVLLPDPFKAAGGSPFHEVNRAYRFVLNGILVPCLYLFP